MNISHEFSVKLTIQRKRYVAPINIIAQSTLFQQGSKDNILLDRMEIKLQHDSLLNFSFLKPFNRKWWVQSIEHSNIAKSLSAVDQYNLSRSLLNNLEWSSVKSDSIKSKKILLKGIYEDPANMIKIQQKDFFLSVNPVIQLQAMQEKNADQFLFLNLVIFLLILYYHFLQPSEELFFYL